MPTPEWQGDNPFCLIIREAQGVVGVFTDHLIDLDQPGWLTEYSHLMRVPGEWLLARKHGSVPVLHLHVAEGEQPYYTARVYTTFTPPAGWHGLGEIDLAEVNDQARVKIYGIGKKHPDGHVDRMWVLPSGAICAGDDDGPLADYLAKQRLAAMLQERINGPDNGRRARGQAEGSQGPEADHEEQADAGTGGGDQPGG